MFVNLDNANRSLSMSADLQVRTQITCFTQTFIDNFIGGKRCGFARVNKCEEVPENNCVMVEEEQCGVETICNTIVRTVRTLRQTVCK